MFDISMYEILVIAVVAIIIVGPKDLPALLRTGAKYIGQLRSMARDFQNQVKEAVQDTELEEISRDLKGLSGRNFVSELQDDVADYLDVEDEFDQADENYIAAGEKMAAAKKTSAKRGAKPRAKQTAPRKAAPRARKTASQKAAPQKRATTKATAKKPATARKGAAKSASSKASS